MAAAWGGGARARGWLTLGLVGLGLAACEGGEHDERFEPLGASQQSIIYGEDDRREVYEHPSATLRALAASSVVALVPRLRFHRLASGDTVIAAFSLQEAYAVCADERFTMQPTAADCTGVLIDDDLVLTAGHCFESNTDCGRYAYVFDYFYEEPGRLAPIGAGDSYGCRRIVARSVSTPGAATRTDYAIVQLERPAAGRTPATVRSAPIEAGEPLATIGAVSGLPVKIDSGARVLSTRAPSTDYFLLDSDTFAGSSGSGVFDASGQLVGVLVRGGEDYVMRPDAGCMVPKSVRLGDGGLSRALGEEATYIARTVEGLCARSWPSARLCGIAPRCGDGICSSGETRLSCAADCTCRDASCLGVVASSGSPGAAAEEGAKSRRKDDGCALGATRGTGLLPLVLPLLVAIRRRRGARRGE